MLADLGLDDALAQTNHCGLEAGQTWVPCAPLEAKGWRVVKGQCQLIFEDFKAQHGGSQKKAGFNYQRILGRHLPVQRD